MLFYFFPWVFINLIINVYSLLGIVRVILCTVTYSHMQLSRLSLFNFQGPFTVLSRTACIVYHLFFPLSILFLNFFKVFSKSCDLLAPLLRSFVILSLQTAFVNTFFDIFFVLSLKFITDKCRCCFLCILHNGRSFHT